MVSFDSVLCPLVGLILGMSVSTSTMAVGDSGGSRIGKCKYQFNDNNTVIDLNPLASHDGTNWKFNVSGPKGSFRYLYSPCWPMDHLKSEENACGDAVACQEEIQAVLYYNLGDFPKEKFNMDGASVVLSYSGETGGTNRTSQITLVCDKTSAEPTFTYVEETGTTPYITYKFTLRAKECCPVSIGGLSFGSILCIIFVVVLVVYLVAGVLINKFARGATGAELIPNRAFWADLPSLIKEGFQFTGAKISGCFSRDSQYDQI